MARYVAMFEILNNANEAFATDTLVQEGVHIAGKIMRLLILERRQRGIVGNKPNGQGEDPDKRRSRDEILQNARNKTTGQRSEIKAEFQEKIRIIDLDYDGTEGKQYDYIELPTVPIELSYSMNSKFVGVATIGRNNPRYHFTGSEDQLEFDIDWFSDTYHMEDVIWNCRWLETLTKNNQFQRPHRVKIQWGKDDKLFQDDIWLLKHAPYKLRQFNRGYREVASNEFVSTSMLPVLAKQTVKFVRVTRGSRLYSQIMGQVTNDLPSTTNRGTLAQGGYSV